MSNQSLFTSESVSEGHPDKVADQISDAVVDAMLAQDSESRVACETMIKTGIVILAGEIRSDAVVDFDKSHPISDRAHRVMTAQKSDSIRKRAPLLTRWDSRVRTLPWE